MKKILQAICLVVALLFLFINTYAQGCVALRGTGMICTMQHPETTEKNHGEWQLSMNNRYFKSFRHFAGPEEKKERVDSGTEVINHTYTLDLALTRKFNNRFSFSLNMPLIYNARSSLYEHGNTGRYSTHSFGLGDIRLTGYAWLLDPLKSKHINIQAGLGIKLPTGDYRYQDYFYNDSSRTLGPVDQSIQLGDGGTGFTTELNAFISISKALNAYGSFFYLFNPREQNGVSTARGGVSSSNSIKYGSNVMSVPDQFMIRTGVNYIRDHFIFSAGFRNERLPAKDLIGGSEGFRRTGYILSVEPGITYNYKNLMMYVYVPVAVDRNRIQSVPDMHRTKVTGEYYVGDAAFADYAVNVGMSVRL